MMIKCQKCGFENQMGSIFCRECGEKLNMDAIDPNKLQKDVNKEKNLKRAKKRIKEAISTGFAILIVAAFLGVVFYNGGLRQYEESTVTEASANQKFSAAVTGTSVGRVKYSYPEINRMLKSRVVDPLAEIPSFAKVTNAEVVYDEEKNQPVVYLWISLKDKVPVIYTIHGDIVYTPPASSTADPSLQPLTVKVDRLDIGRLPVLVSSHTFLNGFLPLLQNVEMQNFFARAKDVEFTADGMSVNFSKDGPTAPASSSLAPKASASAGVAALKGGSTAAVSEKDQEAAERKRQLAEEKKQKAAEEAEKKKALEEERKRKAEEYRQQQKEKEEERKRKLEEEKQRKQEEKEERERQIREENERRRQEREDRRRDRENNNYNNRSSRSSRSSRNRY